jgi:hypothetical protein
MTDFCLFQSHLLSQSGSNTVLLMLFVIMTGFRENTYKCSPLVTKWQIILHFHCCFNNKYTPYFLG